MPFTEASWEGSLSCSYMLTITQPSSSSVQICLPIWCPYSFFLESFQNLPHGAEPLQADSSRFVWTSLDVTYSSHCIWGVRLRSSFLHSWQMSSVVSQLVSGIRPCEFHLRFSDCGTAVCCCADWQGVLPCGSLFCWSSLGLWAYSVCHIWRSEAIVSLDTMPLGFQLHV